MPTTLAAHEQSISKTFGGDYVFKIPGYQRPYAWTTDQARDLLDDLWGFMTTGGAAIEKISPYFLGSIVLIKPEAEPDSDVVDGQQRLTTLTLLLSAIRANVPAEAAGDITQLIYEKGSQIRGTQDRFRLSLRPRDLEFFQTYVQREDGFAKLIELGQQDTDSRRNLVNNGKLYDERVKGLSVDDRVALAQFIVTRCFLVVVATPDLDSAYRIFSILNSRGLDLAPTDILKAEIVGGIEARLRDGYTKKWEDLEEDLGRAAFNDLFSHIRTVYRKAKLQSTVLKEFREYVAENYSATSLIDDVLLPMGEVYEELTDAAYESTERAEAVNESLKWLNRLEFNDWIPPALAFAVRNQNKPAAMEAFFGDLERIAYSMLVRRVGINDRIDRFSKLTKEVETSTDLFHENSALQLSPAEQFNTYRVLSGQVYEALSARGMSGLLLRLDSLMAGGGASYDYETITVEHVLPQNPKEGSQWTTWFPDPANRAAVVHTLGNLALLTRKKNSAANNYEFDKKKEAYFAKGGISPFVLTTQVLRNAEWTPVVVAARQGELLAKLEAHWRLGNRRNPLEGIIDIVAA
jgi:hypothetical protein